MTRQLISDVDWIGETTASRLFDAGYVFVSDIQDCDTSDLLSVQGIGISKAGRLIALDQEPEVPA